MAEPSVPSQDSKCPFCGIASGNPPSPPKTHILHRSAQTLSFFDIAPLVAGHILVIPSSHHQTLANLPAPIAAELGAWIPLLSRALCTALGVGDWNVVCNNGEKASQVVPHVHYHIIPRASKYGVPTEKQRSWVMFGKGQRTDLDDEEAEQDGILVRAEIKKELLKVESEQGEAGLKLLGIKASQVAKL